jgi:peptide/nickel transport system permease protein
MVRASPDVESVPPEPMPPAGAAPGAAPATMEGLVWTRVVVVLLGWGLIASLAYLSLPRIAGIPGMRRVPVDLWLAVATLALAALGMLWWTWRSFSPASGGAATAFARSRSGRSRRGTSEEPLAMAGLVVMLLLYVITLLTPLIAPFDPTAQGDIVASRYLPPSSEHPMGTDKFGRDILSRVLYGARISLSIGFIAVAIGITLGTRSARSPATSAGGWTGC